MTRRPYTRDRQVAGLQRLAFLLGTVAGATLVTLYYEVTVIGGGIPACL